MKLQPNNREKMNYVNNIIGIILLLQPLLNSYSIKGIPGSLSDISILFVVILWFVDIVFTRKMVIKKYNLCFLPFICYVLINWGVTYLFDQESYFSSYFRLIVRYFILIVMIMPNIKLNNTIEKIFSKLSFLLTLYCAVQYIVIVFWKIYLPSYLPFLEYREDLKTEADFVNYSQFYRPHSIFQEPAHFCEFILVYLALLLFTRESNIKCNVLRIFVSVIILLTGSTTGLVGVMLLWGMYLYDNLKKTIHKKKILTFLLGLPFVVLIISKTIFKSSSFLILLKRVFMSNSALQSRFGKIIEMKNLEWGASNYLFGFGYKDSYLLDKIGWLPSYPMILLFFGVTGFVLFFVACLVMYLKMSKNRLSNCLMILLFVLNLATEMFFDTYVVMYLFVICCYEVKKYEERTQS